MFGKHGGKSKGKQPCVRQDLAAAKRQRDVALSRVERAEARATEMQKQWQQALAARNNLKAEQWEKKLEDAERELKVAEAKLEKAEQKYEAKASVQAGRVQAGGFCASACAVVAFGLQHSRMVTVCFLGLSS